MLSDLIKLFDRDLQRLFKETEAFQSEENLWKTVGSISNTAGNLALHLCGNLRTFIGLNLGEIPYERNRDTEFSTKNVAKTELLNLIGLTKETVLASLQKLSPEQLETNYPGNPLGYDMTVGFFLVHLSGHLNYHLGQINYLRRVLE